MRIILAVVILSVSLFLFYSCDNTLDIIEESGEIPIVYGFLSPTDTIQFVRVERAFVDPNTSALELAKDPAVLYYDESVTVKIRNENTDTVYNLQRIDASAIGYPRESGIFPESPNILYAIHSDDIELNDEDGFILEIQLPNDAPLITARTRIVGESGITRPLEFDPVVDFSEISPAQFRWRTGPNAKVYDLYLKVNYQEREAGEDWVNKSINWVMATDLPDDFDENIEQYNQDAQGFFSFISRSIETDPNKLRRFVNMDLTVNGGTSELLEYQRVADANLGITSTQDVPTYTNISEGRGIFASTYSTVLQGVRISPATKDSLIEGRFTKDLNFQ